MNRDKTEKMYEDKQGKEKGKQKSKWKFSMIAKTYV